MNSSTQDYGTINNTHALGDETQESSNMAEALPGSQFLAKQNMLSGSSVRNSDYQKHRSMLGNSVDLPFNIPPRKKRNFVIKTNHDEEEKFRVPRVGASTSMNRQYKMGS